MAALHGDPADGYQAAGFRLGCPHRGGPWRDRPRSGRLRCRRGILKASLFGLVPLVDERDEEEMARGELMRFLAEAAWYPTALLPSQGVQWEGIDDSSAKATLRDGEVLLTLVFPLMNRV